VDETGGQSTLFSEGTGTWGGMTGLGVCAACGDRSLALISRVALRAPAELASASLDRLTATSCPPPSGPFPVKAPIRIMMKNSSATVAAEGANAGSLLRRDAPYRPEGRTRAPLTSRRGYSPARGAIALIMKSFMRKYWTRTETIGRNNRLKFAVNTVSKPAVAALVTRRAAAYPLTKRLKRQDGRHAFQGTSNYVATDDLKVAVNAAVLLRRPLLVKGEPGTGKTVLAEEIARRSARR
jgi:hypothetical protein